MEKDKIIEDLRIHQLELQMQQHELQLQLEKLTLEKRKYEELYQGSPAPYLTVNNMGNILKVNRAMAQQLGLSPHQVNFTSIFPYLDPDCKNTFRKFLVDKFQESVVLENTKASTELVLVNAQGERWQAMVQATVYWDDDLSQPLCQMALCDISLLKQREASLSNALDVIFESSNDAIVVADGRHNIRMFNRAAERMFGYDRGAVRGRPLSLLMPGRFGESHRAKMEAFGQTDGGSWPMGRHNAVLGLRADGREFPIEASVTHFEHQGERLFSAFIRDVTLKHEHLAKIEASEKELAELNAAKDRFLKILAHDLRNPFTTIMGFVEMLQQRHRDYDPDRRERLIGYLDEATKGAYAMLEEQLNWSRVQSGAMDFVPQALDLKPNLFSVFYGLRPTAERRGIRLEDRLAPGCWVEADVDMLRTIVRNLVSNALRFTPEGGEVVVSSEPLPEQGQVCLSVRDTGVGMDREQLARLFDIGQKRSLPDLEGKKGTGLGLVLCHEFARKHGGQLEVESEPGLGTSFHFCLRVAQAPPAS